MEIKTLTYIGELSKITTLTGNNYKEPCLLKKLGDNVPTSCYTDFVLFVLYVPDAKYQTKDNGRSNIIFALYLVFTLGETITIFNTSFRYRNSC